jgi:hypothetical protein
MEYKYLAIGILIGCLSPYVIGLVKSYSQSPEESLKETDEY